MAELKTKENEASVEKFLGAIADEEKRNASFAVAKIMKQVTGHEAKMWGTSIVGFGSYHYIYDSGHEGDTCMIGFSPRKKDITLYLLGGFQGHAKLLNTLGKHKVGKGCLYISSLADIDIEVLKKIIEVSFDYVKQRIAIQKKKLSAKKKA